MAAIGSLQADKQVVGGQSVLESGVLATQIEGAANERLGRG